MATDIHLRFLADVRDIKAKIKDTGSKELRAEWRALEKQYKRAEVAARKALAVSKKGADRTKDAIEALTKSAQGLGGVIGERAEKLRNFAEAGAAIARQMGPAGLALVAFGAAAAAATVAALAMGVAIVKGISAAEGWAAELDKFDSDELAIPPATLDSIERFNDGMSAAGAIAKQVAVLAAGEFATGLATVADGMVRLAFLSRDLFKTLDDNRGVMGVIGRTVLPTFIAALEVAANSSALLVKHTGQLDDDVDSLTQAMRDAANATEDAAVRAELAKENQANLNEAIDRAAFFAAEHEKAVKRQTAALKAQETVANNLIKAYQAQQNQQAQLGKIASQANADQLTDEGKIQAAYEARQEQILKLQDGVKATDAVREAMAANEARRDRDLTQLQLANRDKLDQAKLASSQMDQDLAAQAIDITRKRVEAALEAMRMLFDSSVAAGQVFADLAMQEHVSRAQSIKDRIQQVQGDKEVVAGLKVQIKELLNLAATQSRGQQQATKARAAELQGQVDAMSGEKSNLKQLQKRWKEQRKAANAAFKRGKALAKAAAIADAAAATVALTLSLSYLGFGAPLAAAVITAPLLAANLAQIKATRPPELPRGSVPGDRVRSPDHATTVAVQKQEAVLTGRAVDSLGGAQAVDALNKGQGGGQSLTMPLVIGTRVLAEAVLDLVNGGQVRLDPPRGVVGHTAIYGGAF